LNPKYNAYLTNLNAATEPKKDEWVSKGVEGFQDCGFAGPSSFWLENDKANPYKFSVWAGKVTSSGVGQTGNIKSIKVPKGFKVSYVGQLQKALFTGLTEAQTKEIANLCNGGPRCDYDGKPDIYNDDACIISKAYWIMNLNIFVSEYVQITRLIPNFLGTCITTQNLRLQKANFQTLLNNCLSTKNQLITNTSNLMNSKSNLEKAISDLQTQININNDKIANYNKIISGALDASQWIESAKKYADQNAQLQKQIDAWSQRLDQVNCQINLWTNALGDLNKQITNLKGVIAGQDADILKRTDALQGQLKVIQDTENSYKDSSAKYTAQVETNKAKETLINNIKKQIEDLTTQMNAITAEWNTGKSLAKNQENAIVTLLNKLNDLNAQYNKDSAARITVKDARANNQVTLDSLNIQANVAQTEITNYNGDIKSTTEKINANKAQIEKNTTSGKVETKTFYQGEVTKLTTANTNLQMQIDVSKNDLAKTTSSITTNNAAITDADKCIQTNTNGLKDVSPKYDASYASVQKQADAMTALIASPDGYLKKVRYSFDDVTKIDTWLLSAKTNLFEYIDLLEGNQEPVADLKLRRKRKMRRMRRRMF